MKQHLLSLLLCAAALFGAAVQAQAAPLPGGLQIVVGSTTINTENCHNVTNMALKSGHITYDIPSRTLRLRDVNIDGGYNTLISFSGSDEPVTVEIYGTCNIKSTSMSNQNSVIKAETPIVLTAVGTAALNIKSTNAFGFDLYAPMTIQGGLMLKIDAGNWAIVGNKQDGIYPDLSIDGSYLLAHGKNGSIGYVQNLVLNDSELPSDITWNSAEAYAEKNGSQYQNDIEITRSTGVYYLSVLSDGGKVYMTDGSGSLLTNPCKHGSAAKSITLHAEDNDDYTFMQWNNGTTDKDMTVTTSTYSDEEYTAYFSRHINSTQPWYIFNNNKLEKSTGLSGSSTIGSISALSSYKLSVGAGIAFVSNMYFLYATNPEANKAGIRSCVFNTFDLSTLLYDQEVIAAQSDYYPVYAVAFRPYDQTFYCCAKKVSEDANYLLEINQSDGKFTEVLALGDIKNPITAMAAGNYGEIYIMEEHADNASLWRYSVFAKIWKSIVKVGSTGAGSSNKTRHNSLGYDPFTGELLWLQCDESGANSSVRVVNTDNGESEYAASYSPDARAMYQLNDYHRVTMTASDKTMGSAYLGSFDEQGFFAVGTKISLYANSASGRKFLQWSDGNTDNPRTETVSNEVSTYTAEFGWEDGVTPYNIYFKGDQLYTGHVKFDYSSHNDFANNGGYILFDPETNTLTLNNVDLTTDKDDILRFGKAGETTAPLTVNVVGTNKITCNSTSGSAFMLDNVNVTFTGSGKLTMQVDNASAFWLNNTNLVFDDLEAVISAKINGIGGNSNAESVTVRGSKLKVKGSSGSIRFIADLETQYCDITAPSGAAFNAETGCVEVSGSLVKSEITFTPWPRLSAVPVEEGTGTFTLVSENTGDEFTNVGWFKSGDHVTVTPHAADGFVFSHWAKDPLWGDESQKEHWWSEVRPILKSSFDEEWPALFYYEPKSTATWYAVYDEKFVSFTMGDHAEHPAIASSPSAAGIFAGDWRQGALEYRNSMGVTSMTFDGLEDNKALSGSGSEEQFISNMLLPVSDMAYDISNGVMYAVGSQKLLRLNYDEKKIEEVGAFWSESYANLDIMAIAVALDGTIYAIDFDPVEGTLYKVVEIDSEHSKVKLESVTGDESGNLGAPVTSSPHSLAFDLATGELFWGSDKYLRVIDTQTAKSYICGDFGMKNGMQDELRAMHCMNHFVSVKVKVAEGCEDMGTVSKSKSKVIAGSNVTITAKANSGYRFRYWKRGDSEIKSESYTVSPKSDVTYTAYFEKTAGLDDVSADAAGGAQKLLIDGVLYILRDGRIYTPAGQLVK